MKLSSASRRSTLTVACSLLSSGFAFAQIPGVQHYGNGCAGTGLAIPTIAAVGAPIENAGMKARLEGFPGPGTHVFLVGAASGPISLAPLGLPTCELNVGLGGLGTVAVPVGVSGEIEIPFVLPVPPGTQLYLQTAYADGLLGGLGVSDGLELTVQPTPAMGTALGMMPASGGVGTELSVAGRFDTSRYRPGDVLLMTDHSRAVFGSPGGVNALGETFVEDDLLHVSPFAAPANLVALFGRGTDVPTSLGQAWVHLHTPADDRAVTSAMFTPTTTSLRRTACVCGVSNPDMHSDLRFREAAGKLYLDYPLDEFGVPAGLCAGDQLELLLQFTLNDGSCVTVSLGPTLPLAADSDWSAFGPTVGRVIEAALNLALSPCTFAVTPTATGFCIECPSPGIGVVHASSFVRMTFDPAAHDVLGPFVFGTCDSFAGPESTNRSTAFETNWFGPRVEAWGAVHSNPEVGYDEDSFWCDRLFGESLTGFGTGTVRSATISIRMKGAGCQTHTDAIHLGWNGTPWPGTGGPSQWDWVERMVQLQALNGSWLPGDDITVCFSLDALPDTVGSGSEYRNLLDALADGELEMYVGDDTIIDSVTLTIVRKK
ncbi:MAG: hypothetical protein AAF628_23030 [Planctomycetota bacterium]